jgi:hypothetical protein
MEDAEESFGTWANLSFIAIHKACTTDVCVSLPAHHCRRPKGGARGWRKLVCGLAWASLLPSILALVCGYFGLNQNVGKLGRKWTTTIQRS